MKKVDRIKSIMTASRIQLMVRLWTYKLHIVHRVGLYTLYIAPHKSMLYSTSYSIRRFDEFDRPNILSTVKRGHRGRNWQVQMTSRIIKVRVPRSLMKELADTSKHDTKICIPKSCSALLLLSAFCCTLGRLFTYIPIRMFLGIRKFLYIFGFYCWFLLILYRDCGDNFI